MQGHDIIVIGSSAGGVEALQTLVQELSPHLPAALFIVQHIAPDAPPLLAAILDRKSKLPALFPADNSPFQPGHIYVAPPDHHLLLEGDHMRVLRGPRENRHRPAIDPLFRSAACSFGPRVVGVVLSGTLDDGTAGLWAVKSCGGKAVVQDPSDALFPCMPRNAMAHVEVDHCLPLVQIGGVLTELARTPVGKETGAVPDQVSIETKAAMLQSDIGDMRSIGKPTAFSCPACHGALWELQEGIIRRFRCHVGHSYLPDSLVADQSEQIGSALFAALAAMQEKAAMLRRLALQVGDALPKERQRYEELAAQEEEQAEVIKRLIFSGSQPAAGRR
ncbi:MAG TPA: chemotaxis protein CheB [Geomonas sp.]|nr:chemotaxis protein CheB [Geomonas sp.]